jgi:hypothetical protein
MIRSEVIEKFVGEGEDTDDVIDRYVTLCYSTYFRNMVSSYLRYSSVELTFAIWFPLFFCGSRIVRIIINILIVINISAKMLHYNF